MLRAMPGRAPWNALWAVALCAQAVCASNSSAQDVIPIAQPTPDAKPVKSRRNPGVPEPAPEESTATPTDPPEPEAVEPPPPVPLQAPADPPASETTDPTTIESKFEERYATDPWYVHLYRTSYAYHGVHPFYMWYWGSHALQHLGKVVIVGGDPKAVRRLGFAPASTMQDALELASDVVGPQPTNTHVHNPPILMADVTP